MIQNIVTSIILYSGTAVDLLIILMLFFAKRKSRKDIINIYLGLGMYILIENNSFDMLWAVLG